MEIKNLLSKLDKLKIKHNTVDVNGYNKDICFNINGLEFKAGVNGSNSFISDLCREICFDKSEQETQRRFFDNFNQLLRYANK